MHLRFLDSNEFHTTYGITPFTRTGLSAMSAETNLPMRPSIATKRHDSPATENEIRVSIRYECAAIHRLECGDSRLLGSLAVLKHSDAARFNENSTPH